MIMLYRAAGTQCLGADRTPLVARRFIQ
jgi:hypothetical protein